MADWVTPILAAAVPTSSTESKVSRAINRFKSISFK